jgi:hypothetical protein
MISEGIPSSIRKSRLLEDTGLMRSGLKPRFAAGATVEISEHTRVSFAVAFGIAPSRQLRIEEEIRTAKIGSLGSKVYSHWSPSMSTGRVAWS